MKTSGSLALLSLLALPLLLLSACPGEDGTSCTVLDQGDGTAILTCTDGTAVTVRDGRSCTVEDDGAGIRTISCDDGTEVTISDGSPGDPGSSCSVTDNGDGTKTIACTDGTSVTVSDGSPGGPGAPGSDGSSCTVTDNGDGTMTIACDDGTNVVVSDGAAGAPGADGTSCTVVDNGDGTKTIACDDGTTVLVTDGTTGPPGPVGPGGQPPLTAETCTYCHGPGATHDAVALHKTATDDRMQVWRFSVTRIEVPLGPPVRPVIEFTLLDPSGAPVAGLTAMRVAVAKLVPGSSGDSDRWVSYLNLTATGPGYERGRLVPGPGEGLLESLGVGNYRYTFDTDLSTVVSPVAVTWEPTRTHRLFLQNNSSSDPVVPGTNVRANETVDFLPGLPSTLLGDTREIVTDDSCNACHGQLVWHGRRFSVPGCVTCHNRGMADITTGRSGDFQAVIHKLHRGADLPSVLAGVPYVFSGSDYSDVRFPRRIADCTACHQGAQANNFDSVPTMEACTSCHDDLSFLAPAPAGKREHPLTGLTDNSTCAVGGICHGPGASNSAATRHADRAAIEGARFEFDIQSVIQTAPGELPKVTFRIVDPTNGNQPYDLQTDAPFIDPTSRLLLNLTWDTRDFGNAGSASTGPGQPTSAVVLSNLVVENAPSRIYSVTSTTPIPLTASGTGMAALEGRFAVTFPGDVSPTPIPVDSAFLYFAVTDAVPIARRSVVDLNKCNACHGTLRAHSDVRQGAIENCASCHNPNATDSRRRPADLTTTPDGKAEEPVDFKVMIHGIHSAARRADPPVVYALGGIPRDWSGMRYPGLDYDCSQCHVDGATALPLAAAVLATTVDTAGTPQDPVDNLRMTRITAVCSSCHDSSLELSHMQQSGGALGGVTQAEIDAVQ